MGDGRKGEGRIGVRGGKWEGGEREVKNKYLDGKLYKGL